MLARDSGRNRRARSKFFEPKLEQSIKETMSKLRSVQLGQVSVDDVLEYWLILGRH